MTHYENQENPEQRSQTPSPALVSAAVEPTGRRVICYFLYIVNYSCTILNFMTFVVAHYADLLYIDSMPAFN